ncbi:MAG: GNAT family N-acetyltransferase [Paracoccaceae bacterium]
MSQTQTRRAVAEDLEALIALRRAFYQSQIAVGLLDIPADLEAHLAATTPALITGSRNDLLLNAEGPPSAYLYATTRIVPNAQRGAVGSIEEVFVAPEQRKSGLANLLVQEATAALKARGAHRIQLRVLANNTAGRRFWQTMGFVENLLFLELPMGEAE